MRREVEVSPGALRAAFDLLATARSGRLPKRTEVVVRGDDGEPTVRLVTEEDSTKPRVWLTVNGEQKNEASRGIEGAREENRLRVRVAELIEERNFLLGRSRFGHPDVGLSSVALVEAAITGTTPRGEPSDSADLARCDRTWAAAPVHLKPVMESLIREWRTKVSGGGKHASMRPGP